MVFAVVSIRLIFVYSFCFDTLMLSLVLYSAKNVEILSFCNEHDYI